jgi:hypothetical protein
MEDSNQYPRDTYMTRDPVTAQRTMGLPKQNAVVLELTVLLFLGPILIVMDATDAFPFLLKSPTSCSFYRPNPFRLPNGDGERIKALLRLQRGGRAATAATSSSDPSTSTTATSSVNTKKRPGGGGRPPGQVDKIGTTSETVGGGSGNVHGDDDDEDGEDGEGGDNHPPSRGTAATTRWRASPCRPTEARLTVIHITDVYTLEHLASLKTLLEDTRAAVLSVPPDDDVQHRPPWEGGGSITSSSTCAAVVSVITGDFLSPYLLSSIDRGNGMMNALNKIPMDYVTWGNHEVRFARHPFRPFLVVDLRQTPPMCVPVFLFMDTLVLELGQQHCTAFVMVMVRTGGHQSQDGRAARSQLQG